MRQGTAVKAAQPRIAASIDPIWIGRLGSSPGGSARRSATAALQYVKALIIASRTDGANAYPHTPICPSSAVGTITHAYRRPNAHNNATPSPAVGYQPLMEVIDSPLS